MTVLWSAGYLLTVLLALTWPRARWARRAPWRWLACRRRAEWAVQYWRLRVRCACWWWGSLAALPLVRCVDGDVRRRWEANRLAALDRIAEDWQAAKARHAARWWPQ